MDDRQMNECMCELMVDRWTDRQMIVLQKIVDLLPLRESW